MPRAVFISTRYVALDVLLLFAKSHLLLQQLDVVASKSRLKNNLSANLLAAAITRAQLLHIDKGEQMQHSTAPVNSTVNFHHR
jgi:hypothetical protein